MSSELVEWENERFRRIHIAENDKATNYLGTYSSIDQLTNNQNVLVSEHVRKEAKDKMERGGIAGVSGLRGLLQILNCTAVQGWPCKVGDGGQHLSTMGPSSGAKNSALNSVEEGPQLYGTCSANRVSC